LRIFENRVLRKIFEPERQRGSNKRVKKIGNNKELYDLHYSSDVIRWIKSRRM
jgi:hypothetical protein